MRKFIIDTDTGSDDASALLLALLDDEIDVLGITTLGGNISLRQATDNALMTVEVAGKNTPVYMGAPKPLFRHLEMADGVHGKDGMGDMDLIHPTTKEQPIHAIDFIIETVKNNPNEIELIALGPATNIALALLKDEETMKKVKHIYSMGTAGFGPGNATPVSEFNVYVDAESYKVMLESGIPITIIGFDLCLGPAAFSGEEIDDLMSKNKISKFAMTCCTALRKFNLKHRGVESVDLPDAVAMAVALWDDLVIEEVSAYCFCCTKEEETYGQVIVYAPGAYSVDVKIPNHNAVVIKTINHQLFKNRLKEIFTKSH